MIVFLLADGSHDVHLTADEAAGLQAAILRARPRGTDATPDGRIRVHVHSEPAEATPAHRPIDSLAIDAVAR